MRKISLVAIASTLLLAAMPIGFAGTEKDFFQNTDLTDGNNYNPAVVPSSTDDVLLTTSANNLAMTSSLSMDSLNQTNNATYTISNNTSGSTGAFLSLGPGTNTIGAAPNDFIYLGGATSTLTIQGANSGTGSGMLAMGFSTNGGVKNFDVVQPGAALNISASIAVGVSATLAKTGAGTLNISNVVGGAGASFEVDQGTVNLLPGADLTDSTLSVNNLNTGPASAVVANLQTSLFVRGLSGTIATASSGTNLATINLVGAGNQFSVAPRTPTSRFEGDIAGDGSVTVGATQSFEEQVFAGHNTYTGTTTINTGSLRIDGTTSGQGNYSVLGLGPSITATLTGSGTIGLAANKTITVGSNSALTTGPSSGIGTLHVTASGTGGVIFGDGSTFLANIGPAGASDLLAIAGGKIDLTSSTNTLSLNHLNGAFDGSNYTIATFASTGNYGVFETVAGLPQNYSVVYNATDIMLVAVPEPTMPTMFGLGMALIFARFLWGGSFALRGVSAFVAAVSDRRKFTA